MSTLGRLQAAVADHRLAVFGTVALTAEDGLAPGLRTLVLLGPGEPGFWAHVTDQPEWRDGAPDPIDRWSRRVIDALAAGVGGQALYPFGGPPYRPFYQWAVRSGRAWASPVTLLVHDRAGLFASYRGAVAISEAPPAPAPQPSPCEACADKPCLSACPPRALTAKGYDLPTCHAFLDGPSGRDCLIQGCVVRRACPVSRAYGRLAAQSAYHMRLFHP